MGCCGDAYGWAKIGLLCVVCASGLQTTGYVTNNWMVYNTIQDQVDVRVGLWWFTNCSVDISCYTELTPSSYKSLSLTFTQGLEGVTAGLLLIITIIYCFYVMADRSRTRVVAISIVLLLVVTVGCSVGGFVMWILQMDYPYFVAWSAGLSIVTTAFFMISLLCLIPDIKDYPYEKMQIMPEKRGRPQGKSILLTKHGSDNKKGSNLGRDYSRKDPYSDVENSRGIGNEYERRYEYSWKNKGYMDSDVDRFSLNVVTPSHPPRADFFTNNVSSGNRL